MTLMKRIMRYYVWGLTALSFIMPLAYFIYLKLEIPVQMPLAVPLSHDSNDIWVKTEFRGTNYILGGLIMGPFGILILGGLIYACTDKKINSAQFIIFNVLGFFCFISLSMLFAVFPLARKQQELLATPQAFIFRLNKDGVDIPFLAKEEKNIMFFIKKYLSSRLSVNDNLLE